IIAPNNMNNLLNRWSIYSGQQWSVSTGRNWSTSTGQQWSISPALARKSGSRFIWENNGHSDEYLIKLSSILNHSSTSITRRYLGISREEIKDIYQSFDELM
ncbi:MAG: hypothetical protein KGO81_02655, partial [Bacteroidota bacterium]|nr:hypothetical protein [Bacteroidota bacterium]